MDIIFLLIGVSLVLVVVIARLFFWAIKSGQYDDLEAPRHQILMDDDDETVVSRRNREREGARAEDPGNPD